MSRGEGWAFNRLESRNEVMVQSCTKGKGQDEDNLDGWKPLVFDSLVLEELPGLTVRERMLGMNVVGVVILLGPRLEGLVSKVLDLETRKRSRFPAGLEPKGAATGDKTALPPRETGRTLSSVSPLKGGIDDWCKGLVYRFAAERTDDARAMLHDLLLPLQPALGGRAPYSREGGES
ncbi:unnamed protein product [Ectocarpus sp. 8 AP-2014]